MTDSQVGTSFRNLPRIAGLLVAALLATSAVRGADPAPDEAAFFEQKIRPVLVAHCYECHSAKASVAKKLKAGLRVDTRDGLRSGGHEV